MRSKFVMTKEQMDTILDACKPVPYMVIGGIQPRTPQQNANDAWCNLGREMGFDGMTVQPDGSNPLHFTAEGKAPITRPASAESIV